MKEGKASVWIVVPFTIGVATVRYSLNWFYAHHFWMCFLPAACLAGAFALAWTLWRGAIRTKNFTVWQSRSCLCAMLLLAGAAICLISNLPADVGAASAQGLRSSGDGIPAGRIARFAAGCGTRFRAMIGRVPFRGDMTGAMVKALLAGDRSGLSWEVRSSFRDAGASHLLALSGLHLSVIYLIFSKVLSVTGNSPTAVRIRSVLIIAGSAFFTLMTGASPSLVRAFLFILLRECAMLLHRRVGTVDIFCMSLMLQLAVCPNDIASVGFQLSYLAMLGIVTVYPPLEKLWDRAGGNGGEGRGQAFGTAVRKIWSLCALSISCQLFTAPAVLLRFGTFPRYFLITNLFCLPLSNVLITVSVIDVVLYPLGLCPGFMLSLTDLLVRALLYILDIISGM